MKNSEVEAILKFYRDIDLEIKVTSEWLERLEEKYDIRKTAGYDGMPHGSGTSDQTALLAIKLSEVDNLERVELVKTRITELKRLRTEILKEISTLNPVHKAIIDGFYIKRLKWERIAEQISYSVRQSKNIRCIALEVLGAKMARNRNISQSKIIAEIIC